MSLDLLFSDKVPALQKVRPIFISSVISTSVFNSFLFYQTQWKNSLLGITCLFNKLFKEMMTLALHWLPDRPGNSQWVIIFLWLSPVLMIAILHFLIDQQYVKWLIRRKQHISEENRFIFRTVVQLVIAAIFAIDNYGLLF